MSIQLSDNAGVPISEANPLPVKLEAPIEVGASVEISNDIGNPIPMQAASLPLPTGAATDATLAAGLGADGASPPAITGSGVRGWLRAIYEKLAGSIAVTGPATNAELRASALPVSVAALPLPASAATETTLASVNTGLGADGTSPPAITGSGVRGWLRAIYEKLAGTLAISAASLPLPTGAATSTKQDTGNTSLASIDTKTPALQSGAVPVVQASQPLPTGAATETTLASVNTSLGADGASPPAITGSGVRGWLRAIYEKLTGTLAISAAALPLPTGASTSAKQDTGNTSLANIDTKTPALQSGAVPVVQASQPLPTGASTETTLAAVNTSLGGDGASPPAIAGSGVRGWLRAIYEKLTSSVAVTGPLTDTQLRASAVPVSAAALPLPTGAATETTLSAQNTLIGAVTETAPASDTASSGLNGRLQRVAQRLTSLIALVPASLGQKAKAASFAVTLASDDDLVAKVPAKGSAAMAGATPVTLATDDTQVGAKITAATIPAGGSGLIGWLSAIWYALTSWATGSGTVSASTLRTSLATDVPLPAGELHIGQVGGVIGIVSQVPVVSSSPAYSIGDAVGGLMTFAGASRASDKTGYIQQVLVSSKSLQAASLDLFLFNANPSSTTIVDNSTFDLASVDYDKVIDVVHITDWNAAGATRSIGKANNLAVPFKPAAGTATIYGVLVARAALTLASTSDLSVTVKTDQD